jgi:ubiquinone/menaquinone biosynthesis C-methylase UbiE
MMGFMEQTHKNYRRFLADLISPHTGELLTEEGDCLVTRSGRSYPLVGGIPVLVQEPEPMHLTAPDSSIISQNVESYVITDGFEEAGRILHLGSGNVPSDDPRVISLDILPCENVDIVAEAERLPFKDNCFDLVESGAVFEHLYDPLAAIAEVKRVLKPGGAFRIDNSFLQPYHGFPGHYFAMTPQANETYLIDDFILLESSIPESGTPLMSLHMMLERFLANLSPAQRREAQRMTLGRFMEDLSSDLTSKNPLMGGFSEYEKRALAATHVVIAQKPKNYEKKLAKLADDPERHESWARLKRAHYTLRTEIMLRYHEIFLYKRLAEAIDPAVNFGEVKFPGPLAGILKRTQLIDPLDPKELEQKNTAMRRQEQRLTGMRDKVIRVYLETKSHAERSGSRLGALRRRVSRG